MDLHTNCFYLLLLCFCISFVSPLYGQPSQESNKKHTYKNAVSLELMGHGFIYSLNYERQIWWNENTITTAQIGVSYYGKKTGVVPLWVPMTINQLFRFHEGHFVELGVGKMLRNDGIEHHDGTFEDDYQIEDWVFRWGYRYQHPNSRWILKAAYTPIYLDGYDFIHWAGTAVGYRF